MARIPEPIRLQPRVAYSKLPLTFERNQGQTDARVKFLARGSGYTLFLTPQEALLTFTQPEPPFTRSALLAKSGSSRGKVVRATLTVVHLRLTDANAAPAVTGLDRLSGNANYFIGDAPARWRTNIPTYAKVLYTDVYRDIDLVYSGGQGQLDYDFIVHPGANPRTIGIEFPGADSVKVDADGDLILRGASGVIRYEKPVVYQEINGVRRSISGGYLLIGPQRLGFQVGAYDPSRPLIIDPVLVYSTHLGGSLPSDDDGGTGIAVDSAGNAYVTGFTVSPDFPITPGAFQRAHGGGVRNTFVMKLNATGTALVYSTYLGGSVDGVARAIAVDSSGNAYLTGSTDSPDFPTTPGAFQPAHTGAFAINAFVTKLNASGSALVYSTYLGGGRADEGTGIAVDSAGNAYVTGVTNSPDFPTTPGSLRSTRRGPRDAFVTKLNASGSALVYSTYLGGGRADEGLGIAVDSTGAAYVTGSTNSPDFPTTSGAFQSTRSGPRDAFVTKLNASGTALVYSTHLGGSEHDGGSSIAVDIAGNAYVTGFTFSSDFPTTQRAFQSKLRGSENAFVTKLNATGTALVYSTYLGGSDHDGGSGIAVDSTGNAYVTGDTNSPDFPTTSAALRSTLRGPRDAFVTKLNPAGTALVYSTYLGGSGVDEGRSIAVDFAGNAYATGGTRSPNFPTTAGAPQTAYGPSLPAGGGHNNAFVAKIADVQLQPCPPPDQGECEEAVGQGEFDEGNGNVGFFSFILRRPSTTNQISGSLQFMNTSGVKLESVTFSSLGITGNTATFAGTCRKNDGQPCSFSASAAVPSSPSGPNSFTISVSGSPPRGGPLLGGSILIRILR
jgi:hypothetical protein